MTDTDQNPSRPLPGKGHVEHKYGTCLGCDVRGVILVEDGLVITPTAYRCPCKRGHESKVPYPLYKGKA